MGNKQTLVDRYLFDAVHILQSSKLQWGNGKISCLDSCVCIDFHIYQVDAQCFYTTQMSLSMYLLFSGYWVLHHFSHPIPPFLQLMILYMRGNPIYEGRTKHNKKLENASILYILLFSLEHNKWYDVPLYCTFPHPWLAYLAAPDIRLNTARYCIYFPIYNQEEWKKTE